MPPLAILSQVTAQGKRRGPLVHAMFLNNCAIMMLIAPTFKRYIEKACWSRTGEKSSVFSITIEGKKSKERK
jgi:hypothetical protein